MRRTLSPGADIGIRTQKTTYFEYVRSASCRHVGEDGTAFETVASTRLCYSGIHMPAILAPWHWLHQQWPQAQAVVPQCGPHPLISSLLFQDRARMAYMEHGVCQSASKTSQATIQCKKTPVKPCSVPRFGLEPKPRGVRVRCSAKLSYRGMRYSIIL